MSIVRVSLVVALLAACAENPDPEPSSSSPPAGTLAAPSEQTLETLAAELAPYQLVFSHTVYPVPGVGGLPAGHVLDKYTLALDGVPVDGAGVRVLRDEASGETRVVSTLRLDPALRAKRPSLRIDAARATLAVKSLGGTVRRSSPRLRARLSEVPGGHVLVEIKPMFAVEIMDTPAADLTERIAHVDAESGALVDVAPALLPDVAVGQGYFEPSMVLQVEPTMVGSTPGVCLTDLSRGDNISNAAPCGPTIGTGLHTFIELPGPERTERVVDTDLHFGNGLFPFDRSFGHLEEGRTVAADAHHAVGVTYDFFRDVFGRRLLGMNDSLQIRVNSSTWIWNAAFSTGDNSIVIGDRLQNAAQCGGSDCAVPAAQVEWLAHEYGHALLAAELGVPGTLDEFGALHEGISDIFAVLADGWWHTSPGASTIAPPRGWFFGDTIFPSKFRQFDKPSLDQLGGKDYWDPTVPGQLASGALLAHQAGGIVRRAFYFLAMGIAPWPTPPTPAPNNTSMYYVEGLPGIGLADAATILYLAVSTQLNPGSQPNFLQFREGMVTAAEYLRGRCMPEYKAVQDAWAAVFVGPRADRVPPEVWVSAFQVGDKAHVVGTINAPIIEPTPYVSLWIDGVLREEHVAIEIEEQGGSEYNYRADATPVPFSELGPGDHVFELRVVDNCYNQASASDISQLDTAPPTGLSATDTHYWRNSKRRFRVKANDPNLYLWELKVGSKTTGPRLTNPGQLDTVVELDLTSLAGGMVPLVLTAKDSKGHVATLSTNFIVDRTPPDNCVVKGTPGNGTTMVGTLTGWDNFFNFGAPVAILDIWLDGQPFWWVDRNYPIGSDRYMTPQGWNGGTFSKTTGSLSAGNHAVLGKCVDTWGNERQATDTFVVAGPPVVNGTISATTSSFKVTATATSAAKLVEIELHEGNGLLGEKVCSTTSCSASFTISATPGTSHSVQLRAFDEEGRMGTKNLSVTIPLPPPPVINSIQKSGPVANPTFTVNASNATKVEMLLGTNLLATDASAPFAIQHSLLGWPTGGYLLTFRAHDDYGRSATATYSVFADNTAPVLAAQVSGNAPPYNVDADVLDNSLYVVHFKVDGVIFATATSSPYEAWYSPADGDEHTLQIEAVDVFFNSTTVELPAPVDDSDPTVTLQFSTSGGAHHFVHLEDSCGIDYPATLYLDGAAVASITSASYTHDWTNLSGTHVAAVEVSDLCGNTTFIEDEFTYMNLPPDVVSVTVVNPNTKHPRLDIVATDDVAVHDIEIWRGSTLVGSDSAAPWSVELDTSTWSDGNHTLTVIAYDDEDASDSMTKTVKADNTPPAMVAVPSHVTGAYKWTATVNDASSLSDVWMGIIPGVPIIHYSSAPYVIQWPHGASVNTDVWVAGEATDVFGNKGGFSYCYHVSCSNNSCTISQLPQCL